MILLPIISFCVLIIGLVTESAEATAAGVVVYALWICVDEIKKEMRKGR